uniref:Scol-LDLA n=1 Tax=Scolopendra viridis TaxID=118503 RepID=A0A4D5RA78_SCOVI
MMMRMFLVVAFVSCLALVSANSSSAISEEFATTHLLRTKRHSDVAIGTSCPLDYPLSCRGVHGKHCYTYDSECDLKADCLDGVDESGCWHSRLNYEDKLIRQLDNALRPLYKRGQRVEPEHRRAVDALMNSDVDDSLLLLYLTSLEMTSNPGSKKNKKRIIRSLESVYDKFSEYNIYERQLLMLR